MINSRIERIAQRVISPVQWPDTKQTDCTNWPSNTPSVPSTVQTRTRWTYQVINMHVSSSQSIRYTSWNVDHIGQRDSTWNGCFARAHLNPERAAKQNQTSSIISQIPPFALRPAGITYGVSCPVKKHSTTICVDACKSNPNAHWSANYVISQNKTWKQGKEWERGLWQREFFLTACWLIDQSCVAVQWEGSTVLKKKKKEKIQKRFWHMRL